MSGLAAAALAGVADPRGPAAEGLGQARDLRDGVESSVRAEVEPVPQQRVNTASAANRRGGRLLVYVTPGCCSETRNNRRISCLSGERDDALAC